MILTDMKPPSGDNAGRCIVIGGGALGFLLASALYQPTQSSSVRPDVVVFSRRPLPKVVVSSSVGGHNRTLDVPPVVHQPSHVLFQSQIRRNAPLSIFLCVPPESTEEVFLQWLHLVETFRIKPSVEFVFCNNGLLSQRSRQLVSENSHRYRFIRAIFFVGAVRKFDEDMCCVQWNGGHLVRWGYISGNMRGASGNSEGTNPHKTSHWMNGHGKDDFSVGFLDWKFEDYPDRLELEKFFTNFMLAAVIGPHAEQNGTLLDKISEKELLSLARQFECLWTDSGVTETSLLENLKSTVKQTANNINSLSLQGVNGSVSTAEYFFKTIEDQLPAIKQSQKLGVLENFIHSARQSWGLDA
jgi:hypothetical protein